MFVHNRKYNLYIALALSIALGVFLWLYSDSPPYGYPTNELSNNYWCYIVDIAHKWRGFSFSFFDKGVDGGMSLFTSGIYPVLNPTNCLAWFLNDDQFYLFKLIEPYVIGFFFTSIFLLRVFELSWPYVLFGSFYYLGLGLSRQTTAMAESPIFLWGSFLFPAMVYAYWRLSRKSIYLGCAVIGSLIALQFAGEGTTQFPQLVIWWVLFLSVGLLYPLKGIPLLSNLRRWLLCCLLIIFMAVGIFGVQFIPTYGFAFSESARAVGHYPVNNFPIIGDLSKADNLAGILVQAFVSSGGGVSMRGVFVLIIACVMLWIANPKIKAKNPDHRSLIARMWLTTGLYFLIPPTAEIVASQIPVVRQAFAPLTLFTFKYGLHILDFCIAVTLCYAAGNERLSIRANAASPLRRAILWFLGMVAVFVALMPVIGVILDFKNSLSGADSLSRYFSGRQYVTAMIVSLISAIIMLNVALRIRHRILRLMFFWALPFLGFMTMVTCYNWNDKGKRTCLEDYHMSSPEYRYYRAAKGKYYMPFSNFESMSDNYNLLYGVNGTSGFFPVLPLRFARFMKAYGHGIPPSQPSASLATYFPVDFTTINHNRDLPWKGFIKLLSGEHCDVWVSKQEPLKVYFSHNLKVMAFDDLVRRLDTTPLGSTVFVEEADSRDFQLEEKKSSTNQNGSFLYSNFIQDRGDRIRFNAEVSRDTFVIIPEMFQGGWSVLANKKKVDIFPANYLFIGFRLPPGKYFIEAKFSPPHLGLGMIINFISIALLLFLSIRCYHKSKKSPLSD